jgi:hypothetical protein
MIGTILSDRYRITTRLGSGGGFVIYRARDLLLGRDVAIKMLLNPPASCVPPRPQPLGTPSMRLQGVRSGTHTMTPVSLLPLWSATTTRGCF